MMIFKPKDIDEIFNSLINLIIDRFFKTSITYAPLSHNKIQSNIGLYVFSDYKKEYGNKFFISVKSDINNFLDGLNNKYGHVIIGEDTCYFVHPYDLKILLKDLLIRANEINSYIHMINFNKSDKEKYFVKKLVNESLDDVLKPKSEKEIVESISRDIYLDLLEDKTVSFYKQLSNDNYTSFESKWNIKEAFKWVYDLEGKIPGLYLFMKTNQIPLKHIFPYKTVKGYPGLLIYDVPQGQLDVAIKEIVSQTYKNGEGFHIKYFKE